MWSLEIVWDRVASDGPGLSSEELLMSTVMIEGRRERRR